MGMKVAKLVRLTNKDEKGNFVSKGEGKITLRKRVVIDESSVKETEENHGISGLLYIVDETATKARDKEVEAEVNAVRNIGKTDEAPVAPAAPSGDESKAVL